MNVYKNQIKKWLFLLLELLTRKKNYKIIQYSKIIIILIKRD